MSIGSRVRVCARALLAAAFLISLPALGTAQDVDLARPEDALEAARARLAELPQD